MGKGEILYLFEPVTFEVHGIEDVQHTVKMTWRKVPFEIETMVVIPLKIINMAVGMGEITKG